MKQGSHRFEWVARRGDGVDVAVEVSTTVIVSKGKALLFVVLRDISAWKEAEESLILAKTDLENRVRERTSDLIAANKRLVREIDARKKTERKMRRSRGRALRRLSEHLQQIGEEGSSRSP